ncbi:MAG: hypothetical protein MRY72_09810 [Aquisalinus sp.]|nr:hypothetical protein [Aquisalinus sp.]
MSDSKNSKNFESLLFDGEEIIWHEQSRGFPLLATILYLVYGLAIFVPLCIGVFSLLTGDYSYFSTPTADQNVTGMTAQSETIMATVIFATLFVLITAFYMWWLSRVRGEKYAITTERLIISRPRPFRSVSSLWLDRISSVTRNGKGKTGSITIGEDVSYLAFFGGDFRLRTIRNPEQVETLLLELTRKKRD